MSLLFSMEKLYLMYDCYLKGADVQTPSLLIDYFQDEKPHIRSNAAYALGELADKRAVDALGLVVAAF